ncbi:hypothetical protein PDJAM_G00013500 [Pangasius djambal]|uniref:Uncharacterized protein n=1 Tax=Pangasius djambal TaxID=1691987 RepID=A0ACC5YL38_9TELE|nr:hypothetical protein [Pangasius djambal]
MRQIFFLLQNKGLRDPSGVVNRKNRIIRLTKTRVLERVGSVKLFVNEPPMDWCVSLGTYHRGVRPADGEWGRGDKSQWIKHGCKTGERSKYSQRVEWRSRGINRSSSESVWLPVQRVKVRTSFQ